MSVEPLRYRGRDVLTFRQIDQLNEVPKGTSFRAFKRSLVDLEEGADFFYLNASEHSVLLQALRHSGVSYPASVNLVLVTRRGYERMQRHLRHSR